MSERVMSNWEDVLNAYLEGRGLRADAEDLLMRLHLSAQDRDLIEHSLRLADELTLALRQPQPPAGAEARLRDRLRACPAPDALPQGWRVTATGLARSAAAAPPAPQTEDDLLDAALEGRIGVDELLAMRDAGRLSESAREALDELRAASDAVNELSPTPANMENRLLNTLRAHMSSEAGEIDEKIADRLLGKTSRPQRPHFAHPDVLAASDEDPDAPPADDSPSRS